MLVFYDSGSDGHLIQGQLAERLGLDVLSREPVSIWGIGHVKGSTEYGSYLLTLGPSCEGELLELEVQGMPKITSDVPEVNLVPIWPEVTKNLSTPQVLPPKVGGAEVGLLLGIRSTKVGPTLLLTLPSGLGVYQSGFWDIYQSRICFGGPHEVFTKAYSLKGMTFTAINTFLTQLARAYLYAPRTVVKAHIDEHGPIESSVGTLSDGSFEQTVQCCLGHEYYTKN